jgi:hypothetical protein
MATAIERASTPSSQPLGGSSDYDAPFDIEAA